MGKIGLFLTGIIVVIVAVAIMPDEALDIAEALYSIPPTPSWTTIEIGNDYVWPNSTQNIITASNYSDKFYMLSDGSILINITEFEP